MDQRNHDDDGKGPLKSEALARDEWRGEEDRTLSKGEAPGHTLPESEAGPGADDEGGGNGPKPIAGTMLPPD